MLMSRKARIAYNGPALTSGEMDVHDLAPALLAFADLIDNANKTLGGKQKIKVFLNQDSLRKGSFDITFVLDVVDCLLQQAKLFTGMAEDIGLKDIMEILGWSGQTVALGAGIFGLLKKVGTRKLTGIAHKEKGQVNISLEDGTSITTTEKVLKVFLDVNCRMSIEKVIHPVCQEGIDSFELRNPDEPENKEPIERITKNEISSFVAPPAASIADEEPKESSEQELLVKISLISFEKGKWKLTDGNNTFWAKIEDEGFIKNVESGTLSFTNGDMLRVKYYTKQYIKNGSLTTDYIVTKVLKLEKRPEQIKLDFKY